MSEANGSKAKTESTSKVESKSESTAAAATTTKVEAKAKAKAKDDSAGTPDASADTKTSDAAKDSGADAGKSARESIGGKTDVHYGYFSSVRTPAYRSGWDAIWGSKNGESDEDGAEAWSGRSAAPAHAAKPRKRRSPITLTLDLDELPPPLKDGLVAIARAELKKSRVSYERRDKAGAVDWNITCRVD